VGVVIDVKDYLDLLSSDARLRTYNWSSRDPPDHVMMNGEIDPSDAGGRCLPAAPGVVE
jgi:hypothetical protein